MSTTDGPFAETKEQLGGFILIDPKDLNEAIRMAAGIPLAKLGSIEVPPVMGLDAGRQGPSQGQHEYGLRYDR
jgi:hypothetical protein